MIFRRANSLLRAFGRKRRSIKKINRSKILKRPEPISYEFQEERLARQDRLQEIDDAFLKIENNFISKLKECESREDTADLLKAGKAEVMSLKRELEAEYDIDPSNSYYDEREEIQMQINGCWTGQIENLEKISARSFGKLKLVNL